MSRHHPYTAIWERPVFLFFSNRLGCAGSLLLSLVVTLVLLAVLRAL